MRVLIAAGGTGGHFYPGLAVARECLAKGDKVLFVIKKGDYVRPLLEREKIDYATISAGGFERRLTVRNVLVIAKLVAGFFEALFIVARFRPSVVMVFGGYLSVPPALAAKLFFIPVVLHEQNAIPGWANRFLSSLAAKVAVSFPGSEKTFGPKAVLTGNPVRKEFLSLPTAADARKKWGLSPTKTTVLIFGGSLGAKKLNALVLDALADMSSFAESLQIIHITGAEDITSARQRYEKMAFQVYVDSYCHDMPSAYAASDFVISRSGASTVAELMVVKKLAIFVPYPLATNAHQTANAKLLVDLGLARMHEQKDLTKEKLRMMLESFMKSPALWLEPKAGYERLPVEPGKSAGKIESLIREVGA